MYNGIPDYYLGCLLYYDDTSDDNCKWVVYDGHSKIRCYTRKDAIDYITESKLNVDDDIRRRLVSARLHINNAHRQLQQAADLAVGAQKLVYDRLSVKLKPLLVEIDNQLLL